MVKLHLKTITPLHISSGNELSYNLEYILLGNRLCKLNINKASRTIAKAQLFDFSKNYSYKDFANTIEKNKSILSDEDFDYCIHAEEPFIDTIKNERSEGKKIVKEFVNSNGKFYVPGSSVKGALLTVLRREMLGIDQQNGNISQKFVITDSELIGEENFTIDKTLNRPPAVSLITLDPNTSFTMQIRKLGEMDLDKLRKNLSSYSVNQIKKARHYVEKYTSREGMRPNGADQFLRILENLDKDIDTDGDAYFLNIGFGGGSWFKIFGDVDPPPKFDRPKKRTSTLRDWEAHTTFAVDIENEPYQLGWCKLKIEE